MAPRQGAERVEQLSPVLVLQYSGAEDLNPSLRVRRSKHIFAQRGESQIRLLCNQSSRPKGRRNIGCCSLTNSALEIQLRKLLMHLAIVALVRFDYCQTRAEILAENARREIIERR